MPSFNAIVLFFEILGTLTVLALILYGLLWYFVLSPADDEPVRPLFKAGARVPTWEQYQAEQAARDARTERWLTGLHRDPLSLVRQAQIAAAVAGAIRTTIERSVDPLTSPIWYVDPAEFVPGFSREVVPWALT